MRVSESNWSTELESVFAASEELAATTGHSRSTAHLLLAVSAVDSEARRFLLDHGLTDVELAVQIQTETSEQPDAWNRVLTRALDVSDGSGEQEVTVLHLLVALCSIVDSAAYSLMRTLKIEMGMMRSRILSTMAEQRHLASRATTGSGPSSSVHRPPSGAVARVSVRREPSPEPVALEATVARGGRVALAPREPADVSQRRRVANASQRNGANNTTRDLALRLHEGQRGRRPGVVTPSGLPLPPSVRRSARPAPREAARFTLITKHVQLREKDFPHLTKLGRNLTALALEGKLDAVVGRESEVNQLIDILNKRRANNAVLVGEPGVGKTAVVEGLAMRCAGVTDDPLPAGLEGRIIIELEASKMVAGTGVRGSFAERLQALKAEVMKSNGRVILFLDELHHWIGMGSGDGASDGAGELKTALARGELPCIGATTFDEFHRHIESDPAFARRFQTVRVNEPSLEQALTILRGVTAGYARHHDVEFCSDAVEAAVRLTHRYLPDRRLPDKAIGVLDQAGSRARRTPSKRVDRALIADVVAGLAGVPPEKLMLNDRERFSRLAEQLREHIVGHASVIEQVAQVLRRNFAGFVTGRPIGSFLFLGSTGVGKTEFAKAIARVLFDDDGAVTRFDMSEFMEASSVSRLIGSPPGYIGHDAGGQLTESIRRCPYQLVLLDEIEKAHPDVLNLLLQLLDEGRLTDSHGRSVDFSNTVIVMTSNLGADEALKTGTGRRVGFSTGDHASVEAKDDRARRVTEEARRHFRVELWNRISDPLVFLPLSRDDIAEIAAMQLNASSRRLSEDRQIAFTYDSDVIDLLIERGGFVAELGARPMRNAIENQIEGRIADMILRGDAVAGSRLHVTVNDGAVQIALVGG